MSASDEAKEIIRRWNEEGWSGGKYELAHEIISPDMQVHGAGGQAVGMGPDGLIDLIKTWRTAFPDGRMEIDDLIVEGDTVAIRNTWYGTQSEEFYGIPPSGKHGRRHLGRDRPRPGRARHRGLGRARHDRDDAADGRAAHRRPRRGRGRRRPDLGPDRLEPERRPARPSREPRDPRAASSQAMANADAGAAGGARRRRRRSSTTAPAGARATSTRCSTTQRALRAAMPDLSYELDTTCMVSEGDQVAGHSSCAARTRARPLYGAEPSGNELVWTHSDFVRIARRQDRRALDGDGHADAVPAGRRLRAAGGAGVAPARVLVRPRDVTGACRHLQPEPALRTRRASF